MKDDNDGDECPVMKISVEYEMPKDGVAGASGYGIHEMDRADRIGSYVDNNSSRFTQLHGGDFAKK